MTPCNFTTGVIAIYLDLSATVSEAEAKIKENNRMRTIRHNYEHNVHVYHDYTPYTYMSKVKYTKICGSKRS